MTTFGVALFTSVSRTCCGVKPVFALSTSAAAPVTCGVAIEVPLIVFVAVSLVFHAEVMFTPGAKMSRQGPKFENEARLLLLSVGPTVVGVASPAGGGVQGAGLSLPAWALSLPAAML